MFFTVYKITNNINNKVYIGIHRTTNLEDKYMGSGLLINKAIEKYGLENFNKEYIAIFDNKDDMFYLEKQIVDEKFVNDPTTYNLKVGGDGGWDYCNKNGLSINNFENNDIQKRATESAKKILKELRENPDWEKAYSNSMSISRLKYYKDGGENGFKNKKHTNETKDKIGKANSIKQKGSNNSNYGKVWVYNLDLKQSKSILKNNLESYISNGWIKGRKLKFS